MSLWGDKNDALDIYHIGKAANFDRTLKNKVITVGAYDDAADVLTKLALIDPHLIWYSDTVHSTPSTPFTPSPPSTPFNTYAQVDRNGDTGAHRTSNHL